MRSWWILGALALAGLGLWVAPSPSSSPRAASSAEPAPLAAPALATAVSTDPVFVLSGNDRGFIRPCGCSKPKLGGVDRRATLLDAWRAKHPKLVALSLGGLVVAGGPQQQLKFEHFLIAMGAMQYRAGAIGLGELQLGAEYLRGATAFASFPLVATNLRFGQLPEDGDASNLETVFAERADLGEGWSFAHFLPALENQPEFTALPWRQLLPGFLESLGDEGHALIGWAGKQKGAEELVAAIPEPLRSRVYVLFGGAIDQPRVMEGERAVPLVAVGYKGARLARLQPGKTPLLHEEALGDDVAGRPDLAGLLQGYRGALAAEDFVSKVPRFPNAIRYVGSASCAECHEDCTDPLADSRHERAWATLVATGDHVDPECVSCHVTGWAQEKGFVSEAATPHLRDVSCEACHGPGELHVEWGEDMPRGKPQPTYCVKCHDPENSPGFSYEKYWPKIAHPKKK